ncbi:ABC transporter permease [Shewanella sp. OMA3-2]|uniref:ABC transporter permease n=1 Tax=Shewanella sp. OMA3-2 TaxID=2908650 RepID=UPI001F40D155|nr:ABC transporter permease subunit [Shewanella sp. OMA3-2]UJF21033.1 ABC transporter permease [Shewanella sp. OMA3-2]
MNNPTLSPPSALFHIWLLARFELTKRFSSRSGIIALIAFIMVWSIILIYPVKEAATIIMQPSFKEFMAAVFGPTTLDQLFNWKVAEFAVFWVAALYLFPLFSIFISADQFSSDKQRGTLRFISLRVSRNSLFLGRFIGQVLIQSLLILLTLIVAIALIMSRDSSLLFPAINTAMIIFASVLIVVLPYIAMMALLSIIANSARQASIFAVILWIIVSLVITLVNVQLPGFDVVSYLLPGSQLSDMVNTQGLAAFTYTPIPLLQTVAILIIGRIVMQRSAL